MYFDENNNYFDIFSNDNNYDIEKYTNASNQNYYDIDKINNKSKNNSFDIKIESINFNRNSKLYSIEEGFNKGNIFENLYSKYKNHVYKLRVNNKKDEMLYKIQMYTFAMKDLNLYLDVHPTDESMIQEYQRIKRTLEEVKKNYENTYGPLCASNVDSDDKWTWINNPWPWDKGGN